MAKVDCATQVYDFLVEKGIKLNKKTTETVLSEVERRMKRYGKLERGDPRWGEVAQAIIEDVKIAAWAAKRNHKLQKIRARGLDTLMDNALASKGGTVSDARRASTVGATTRFEGSTQTASAMADAIFAAPYRAMVSELNGHKLGDLHREFSTFWKVDHQKQKDLAMAMEKLDNPDAPGTKNEMANAAAAIMHKYRRQLFKHRNRAGAYVKELKGFAGSQHHDTWKIGDRVTKDGIKRREGWLAEMRKRLSDEVWYEHDIDPQDPKAMNEWLDGAADNIISGKPDYNLAAATFTFDNTGSMAKSISEKHRKLHFKNAGEWYEYNKKYGTSQSVVETLASDMQHMAREIAIMEKFGPDARGEWDRWTERTRARHAKGKGMEFGEGLKNSLDQNYFDSLFPESQHINSRFWSKLEQGVLAFNNLGKLPLVTISSLTDFMFQGAAMRRLTGGGSMHSFHSVYKSFKGMAPDEQDMLDRAMGYIQEGMISNMAARTDPTGEFTGRIQKANNIFFWANGLQGWTNHNKKKMAAGVTGYFGENAKKAYGELDDHFRQILKQGGIFEDQWDVLRQATFKSSRGNTYIIPEFIRNLDDSAFKNKARSIEGQKDELVTQYNVLVNSFIEAGVPTPGARERGELQLWQAKGTFPSFVIRAMTQFKSFPLTVWNKIVLPAFRDKHTKSNFDTAGMAILIGESILFGGAVIAMKDAIKGRKPEAIVAAEKLDEDPRVALKYTLQAMLQGGALSIYGDLLMQDYTRFGTSFGGTLAGPTASTLGRGMREFSAFMRGEGDPASAIRAINDNLPFVNYPGLRTATDYLVGFMIQDYLNPGYVKRMERYQERENRPFMLPPTQYAVGL